MKRGFAVRLIGFWDWAGLPSVLCVLATLLLATPVRLFGLSFPEPVFPLCLAFIWPLIQPSGRAALSLFALGLFLDLFWGGPLGMWAICLLVVYGGVLAARPLLVGQDWPSLMGAWTLAVAVTFMLCALFLTLKSGAPSLVAVSFQAVATFFLFPLWAHMLATFDDTDVRFK